MSHNLEQHSFRSKRCLLAALALLLALVTGASVADNRIQFTTGFIAAVGIETDDDGHPMLAEYDAKGFFVADVGFYGLGDLEDVTLYPAASWRVFQQVHQAIKANNPELTRGAQLMSREQYENTPFRTRDGTEIGDRLPTLRDNTKSVYVISPDRMLNPAPVKEGFVLAEYPVALHQNTGIGEEVVTLILNPDGEIVRSSNFDVSFKAAIYKDDQSGSTSGFDLLWQPIPNAEVFAGGNDNDFAQFPGGKAVSFEDGRYSMIYSLPACPGFSYMLDVPIIATIGIENFNPKSDDEQGFLTALRYDSKVCVGYGDVPLGNNPLAIAAQLNAQAIVATLAVPVYNVNVTFSTMQLNGLATIPGVVLGGNTVYEENAAVELLAAENYRFDFNLDGDLDTAVVNADDPNKIDIFFSPNRPTNDAGEPNVPDITRVPDYVLESQLNPQGLLKEITRQDLEDTDIYVYRRATGQLIGSIEGLAERVQDTSGPVQPGGANPTGRATYRGVLDDEEFASFGFTSFLVGAISSDLISGLINPEREAQVNRRPWLPTTGEAGGFASDNRPEGLRPGEVVQVIAINRATGYIGSQEITIQPSGTTLVPPTPIQMGPPNLKIIASREFEDYNEITRNEENLVNIIGNEGAGLASDTYVKIQSVWLAANGDALPDNLPGYTGRIAISTGSSTSDFSGNFEIKTGYQTQLVQLNNAADLTREHFYVQVVGENIDGNPVFESPGAGAGRLQTRPKKYVPILVPLLDEQATRTAEESLAVARIEGLENLPERVEPIYRWIYRPEMQFSVYELKNQRLQFQNARGDLEIIDLTRTGDDAPILVLNENLDPVDLLYDLIGPQNDALAKFGPETELVFSIGAEEVLATITEDGSVRFNNVDHISTLREEDFLNIRLYTNNDSANVLWAYSIEYVYLEPTEIGYENQTDDIYYVTADDPEVELKATVAGYAYRPEEDRYPGTMFWDVSGDGSFVETTQISNEFGEFDNTLVMPTVRGARAEVSVTWQDARVAISDDVQPVEWKAVEVLAGEPARIEVLQTGAAIALEQGDLRLEYTIYDAFNNLVEDGTEIEVEFADSLILKEQQLSTIDGKAYLIFSGGEYEVLDTVVLVTSGSVSHETNVTVAGLDIVITADQTALGKQQTVNISALVTRPDGSPVADVPVTFAAEKGIFRDQSVSTTSSGIASTTFTSGLNETADSWIAQVGYVAVTELPYSVNSGGTQSVNAEDAMLVADAAQPGLISFDGYGINIDIAFETEGTVTVRGNVGDALIIGDMSDPNLEPLISLPLNDIEFEGLQGRFLDDHGINSAFINRGHNINLDDDIVLVKDHPLGGGRSAHFKSDSKVTLETSNETQLIDNRGFRLDIKPLGNGDVVSFDKEGLKLSYNNNSLILRVTTDQGPFSVTAPGVAADQWHSVAANVEGGQLNLYVDGVIYSESYSGVLTQGNPLIIDSKSIEIGGLEARIRGFRVYDYGSLPLIGFADDSAATTLQLANETLVIKSLGNLGQVVANSQLLGLRVALITNEERNYASLLSQRGYQDIALRYLYTASPEVPVAGIANPMPGLVPTAHAWTWSGVWDSVKSTVSFLIPYEDFITIGQQLMYLVNRDWENFDPVTLAFASLGAATIIPLAKPLKPLLGPIKRLVDGMKRFPAIRHFAGAVGTAVKSAISGRTDRLLNLLPFILIGLEIFRDPVAFEFMMNAIESEDDLWVWVDYIGEIVGIEGGLDELAYISNPGVSEVIYASNPLSLVVPTAHAASRAAIALVIVNAIKKIAQSTITSAKRATQAIKAFLTAARNVTIAGFRLLLKSGVVIRYFATLGAARVLAFFRHSNTWRINRWFILFSMGFLTAEAANGNLNLEGVNRLDTLIRDALSNNANTRNGALFQLSQVAFFHLKFRFDGQAQPAVTGIEVYRPAYRLSNGLRSGQPYRRRIDIVLTDPPGPPNGPETWIEVKSLSKSSFTPSKFRNHVYSSRSDYRQHFHDMRLNDRFITADLQRQNQIFDRGRGWKGNKEYQWYFHKFSNRRGSPPTAIEEGKVRDWLCARPGDVNVAEYYGDNFQNTEGIMTRLCTARSFTTIELRDTQSYVTDVLEPYAPQLGIEDLVTILKAIGE